MGMLDLYRKANNGEAFSEEYSKQFESPLAQYRQASYVSQKNQASTRWNQINGGYQSAVADWEDGKITADEFKARIEPYRHYLGDDQISQIFAEVDNQEKELPKEIYKQATSKYLPGDMFDTEELLPQNAGPEIALRSAQRSEESGEATELSSYLTAYDRATQNLGAGTTQKEVEDATNRLVEYMKGVYGDNFRPEEVGEDWVKLARERLQMLNALGTADANRRDYLQNGMSLKKEYDAYNSLSDENKMLVSQYIRAVAQYWDEAFGSITDIENVFDLPDFIEKNPGNVDAIDDMEEAYGKLEEQVKSGNLDFNDYLNGFVKRVANAYKGAEYQEAMNILTERDPIGTNVANIISKPFFAAAGVVGAVAQNISNLATGENLPVDRNSTTQLLGGTSTMIQGKTSEMIQNAVPGWGGEALNFVYGLVTSTIDSTIAALANVALPGSGLALIGTEAAASAIYDASKRGASAGQALFSGILAGCAEAAFEKLPMDNVLKTAKAAPGSLKGVLLQALKGAGINAPQEALTTVANTLGDILIMQDKSRYEQAVQDYMDEDGLTREEAEKKAAVDIVKQVAVDAFAGALQGGGMTAGSSFIGHLNIADTGKQIIATPNGIETLLGAAEQGDAAVRQAADAVRQNPSAGNVGNLAAALQEYTKQPVGNVLAYPSKVRAMHNGEFTPPVNTASAASAIAGRAANATTPIVNTTPPENIAADAASQAESSGGDTTPDSTATAQGESLATLGQQVAGILSRPTVTASQADRIVKSPELSSAFTELTGKALDGLTNAEKRQAVQDSAGFTYAAANDTMETDYHTPSILQEGASGGVPYAGQQAAAQTVGGYARTAGAAGYGYGASAQSAASGNQYRGNMPSAERIFQQNNAGGAGTNKSRSQDAGGLGRVQAGQRYGGLDPTFGKTPNKDWVASALVSPQEGSISQAEQQTASEYVVPCFVVADDAWSGNKGDTPAFSENGQIYLRESQSESDRGALVFHELNHVMKQLGFQPYLDFIQRTPDLIDTNSSAARNLIEALAEHRDIDPFSMSDSERATLYDEVNATVYGAYRSGNTTAIDYLRGAFYDFDAYIAELSDIHQQFKEYQQQNRSTQEASGSDGSFFDGGNGRSGIQQDAGAEAGAESTQSENVQKDQYAKPADQWTAENWNAGEGNTQAENAADTPAKALSQLVDSVRRRFGIPITKGRFRQQAYGIFKPKQESIKTRVDNALPTICHELGHYLDKKYGFRSKNGIEEAIDASRRLRPGFIDSYEPTARPGEAVAEFLREYLKDRTKAKAEYPTFYEVFESELSDTDLKNIRELGDEVNQYMMTSPQERARRAIFTREESVKDLKSQETAFEKVRKIGTTFYNHFVDDAAALKIAPKAYEAYYLQKDNDVILDTNVSQNMTTPDRTIALDENGDKIPGLAKVLENVRKGKKAEDFHQYLIYRHGLEWAEQGKRVFGDDTLDNTDFMLSEIDRLDEQYPDFRGISEKLYAWQRRFMQEWLVNTGMLTQETADMLWEKYPCYVPFFRRVEDTGTGVKRGFANQSAPIRRAKGSGLDLYDPVENIIVNMNSMIKSADRNRVAIEIADYVDQTEGSAYLMERVPPDMVKNEFRASESYEARIRSLLEGFADNPEAQQGTIDVLTEALMDITNDDLSRWMVKNRQGKDVIWVMRDGQRQYYQVNNPDLLIALNGMGPQQLNSFFKITGSLSRFLKTTTTGSNVIWALGSNVFRDFQSAFQFSEQNNFFKYTRDYVKSVASQIKKDEAYQAYKAAGGGYVSNISKPKAMSSLLAKVYKQNGAGVRNLLNWAVKGLEAIETLSDIVETAPRLAEFRRVLERTSDPKQAIRAADELTTNFKRRGAWGAQVESLIPYFNASIQGVNHLAQAIKSNPKGFAVKQILTSAIIAAFVIAWNRFWGGEDEYEKMSSYNKNNYYLFHVGDGKFIKIPKAREVSILESLFERTYERLVGQNDQAFLEFSDYIFDSLVPPGIPTPNDPMAPLKDVVLLGSLGEVWANEDYKGAPIVPASLEDLEPEMQYNERTSAFAKAIGRMFNLSPMQIDYIMNSNTGLIGDIIIATTAEQKDFTLGMGNKLISDVAYSGGATSKFYDDAAAAEVKANSYPDNGEYKLLNRKYGAVKSILSKLTQYGKEEKGMERDLKLYAQELADSFSTEIDPRLIQLYEKTGDADIIPYISFSNTATIDGEKVRLTPSEFIDYTEEYQSRIDELYEGLLSQSGLSDEEMAKALAKAKEDLSSSLKNKYFGNGDSTYFDAIIEIGIDPVDYLAIYASQEPNPKGKFGKETFMRSIQQSDLPDTQKQYLVALYDIMHSEKEGRQQALENFMGGIY